MMHPSSTNAREAAKVAKHTVFLAKRGGLILSKDEAIRRSIGPAVQWGHCAIVALADGTLMEIRNDTDIAMQVETSPRFLRRIAAKHVVR